MDQTHIKFNRMKEYITSLGSLAVGFSGGVDSSFLLAAAHEVLGDSVIAVTARSPFIPAGDLDEAFHFCRERGIRHFTADFDPLADESIRSNPPDRCYHCKKKVFAAIIDKAREEGIEHVSDGSNADDLADYRPGSVAVSELGIISPLQQAGLGKEEIRALSKEMRLPTWEKPSAACLASRVPYGDELTEEKLLMIDAAESHIRGLGFSDVRVRAHGDLARIEVNRNEIGRMTDEKVRKEVETFVKGLGFTFVTLDLSGYNMGSLNQQL